VSCAGIAVEDGVVDALCPAHPSSSYDRWPGHTPLARPGHDETGSHKKLIPLASHDLIFPSSDPAKGREPVAPCRVDWMWRPRPCLASTAPGGAGAPPGGTTASCREPADAMRRSRRMEAKRGPAPHRRHDGAPEGARIARSSLRSSRNAKSKVMRLTEGQVRHPVLRPPPRMSGLPDMRNERGESLARRTPRLKQQG
jgi:hypothetical protein